MTWWKSAVVYQIYPRSFADSNGDGIGDLPGVTARLDHLVELGVDALWLSPIYRSPQDDNGYDIADYQDVDPMFGTLADLDALIAAAHARGMKIVMDLVVNHTSDEHPWFVESRSSTDNPRRDWYFWRKTPNDWQSIFSGSAWEHDPITDEYYLHLFSRKQPDLNWENPEVRQAVYAMMRWWVERGVDGFRMDVINLISKPPGLPDGDLWALCANGPRVHEFLAEMHREVLAGRRLLAVGETPGAGVDDARRYSDPARAEIDMVFTFEHVHLDAGTSKWDLRPLRLPARGLQHRHTVAAGEPQPRRDQRRGCAQGPGLGVPPLPAADRAAARPARRGARGLPAPAARRRAGVRLRAHARRHDAHGAGQPLRFAAAVPAVAGEVVLSTHGRAEPPSELAPWESLAVLRTTG